MEIAASFRLSTPVVEALNLSDMTPACWDAFARSCGASMRSAYSHLRWLQLRLLTKGRVQTYGVYVEDQGDRRLIGHATVLFGWKGRRFYNGLNLLPDYADLWPRAMEAMLARLGPGRFQYGWTLSLEPPREEELATLPGVVLAEVRQVEVHAVDFSRWPSWEAYLRDISENNRRNARRLAQANADLQVVLSLGLSALGPALKLTWLRSDLYRRKALSFRPLRVFAGYLTNILLCPPQTLIACAVAEGRVLAAYKGAEFSDLHYYLDGASSAEAQGGGSYLLLAMLKHAFERNPSGKFVMGYIAYPVTREIPEGLLRSRRAVRVTEWPTSLVEFQWTPPETA